MAQQDLRCASMRTPPTSSGIGFLSRNGVAKKQSKIASPARRALKRNRLHMAEMQRQAHQGGRNSRSKAVAVPAGDAACSDESDDAVVGCIGTAEFECDEEVKRDVWDCMLKRERETRANTANISQQPEVKWEMRPILLDFLLHVHQHYKLRAETVYLAVNLLDRYMSEVIVLKKHYQLVGLTCLWIASKFEDRHQALRPEILCYLCCHLYDRKAFVAMEAHVLKTLGWELAHPTCEQFLKTVLSAHGEYDIVDDRPTQHVARFLMELTMFHACFVGFGSHTVAASCLYFSRYINGAPQKLLPESDPRLQCIRFLDCVLSNVSGVVFSKYAEPRWSRASVLVKQWVDSGHYFSQREPEPAPSPAFIPLQKPEWMAWQEQPSTPSTPSTPITPTTPMTPMTPVTPTEARQPLPKVIENGACFRTATDTATLVRLCRQQDLPRFDPLPPRERPRATGSFTQFLAEPVR